MSDNLLASMKSNIPYKKQSGEIKPLKFTWLFDAIVILVFVCYALIFTIGRVGDVFSRFGLLTGDAANYASFAASLDHPEFFVNDPLLHDPKFFAIYFVVHIPLLRLLNQVVGNYGTAFISMLFPMLLMQLLGFYILGKFLFRSQYWAFLLALITSVYVGLNLGEFWGFYEDPLPRVFFQALLPYLLWAALKWGRNPVNWPLLMGGAGLLVYIHPVSAPVWGVAILIGLWFSYASDGAERKLAMATLAAGIFLLVMTPFIVNYMKNFAYGDTLNYSQVMEILTYRLVPGSLDIPLAITTFIGKITSSSTNILILIWGVAGFGVVAYLRRKTSGLSFSVVLASWWAGLILMCVVFPLIEQEIARVLHRTPFEFDLIRGIKYFIPLLLINCLWTLSEICHMLMEYASKQRNMIYRLSVLPVILVGIGLLATWTISNGFMSNAYLKQGLDCWLQGEFNCQQINMDQLEFLDAIHRLTPPGAKILDDDLAIRYYALRSLVYTYKDGATLGGVNHVALLKWAKQEEEMRYIVNMKDRVASQAAYVAFARKYGADYLVLQKSGDSNSLYPVGTTLVFSNEYGSLFKIIK